jgi:CubicO group peptidase (beta-lactamase class C family)
MASCTKSFTAMSVALLVDEGKLEWDKPVREYIPEFILDEDPFPGE